MKRKLIAYVIGQLLLGFVLVAALPTFENDSRKVFERMSRQFPSAEKCSRACRTSIDESKLLKEKITLKRFDNSDRSRNLPAINWFVNSFVMSLKVLLVAFRSTANLTDERLLLCLFGMSINRVTLKSFLQHNYLANRAHDINLDVCVNGFPMVFHVTSSFKGFSATVLGTKEIFSSCVNSLNVILQIVRSICCEWALTTLLTLSILMRKSVLGEKKFCKIAFRAQFALKFLLLEWIFIAMSHHAMFLEAS